MQFTAITDGSPAFRSKVPFFVSGTIFPENNANYIKVHYLFERVSPTDSNYTPSLFCSKHSFSEAVLKGKNLLQGNDQQKKIRKITSTCRKNKISPRDIAVCKLRCLTYCLTFYGWKDEIRLPSYENDRASKREISPDKHCALPLSMAEGKVTNQNIIWNEINGHGSKVINETEKYYSNDLMSFLNIKPVAYILKYHKGVIFSFTFGGNSVKHSVKQYANILRHGSSHSNAALLQQTSSNVSSLIRNSASHAALKQNSKLSPSISVSNLTTSNPTPTRLVNVRGCLLQ